MVRSLADRTFQLRSEASGEEIAAVTDFDDFANKEKTKLAELPGAADRRNAETAIFFKNFGGLVLGCIKTNFFKRICV